MIQNSLKYYVQILVSAHFNTGTRGPLDSLEDRKGVFVNEF